MTMAAGTGPEGLIVFLTDMTDTIQLPLTVFMKSDRDVTVVTLRNMSAVVAQHAACIALLRCYDKYLFSRCNHLTDTRIG